MSDASEICALLESANLPTSDLQGAQTHFLVATDLGGALAATGALQWLGGCALLRSVVVAPKLRGAGLGGSLVAELEHVAQLRLVPHLFLLTASAKQFFEKRGYQVIPRGSVPEELRASEEFISLCPANAACMVKRLEAA